MSVERYIFLGFDLVKCDRCKIREKKAKLGKPPRQWGRITMNQTKTRYDLCPDCLEKGSHELANSIGDNPFDSVGNPKSSVRDKIKARWR